MIGYKLFDENLCCRGFQFEVGKTYTKDTKKEDLQCCTDKVFHYCREVHYLEEESPYRLHDSRICEVIAGDYVKEGQKYGTNKLTILREITGNEKLELIKDMCNIINQNNGYCNDGIRNTGNRNSGNYNTGNCNKGNLNSGYSNNGYYNTGDHNNGNCNAGNYNNGYYNTGDRNTGNWNTGSWNTGNYNNGFFNTDDAYVRMFNKETTLKKSEINLPSFLYFDLTEGATTDEYKKAFRIAWDKASKDEHKKLLDLPNWNNEIFKEISGIDAEEEIAKETETETETIDLVDVYIAVMNYGSGNIDMYTVQMTPNYQIKDVEDWLYSNTNFSCSDCYYMCSSSEIRVDYV